MKIIQLLALISGIASGGVLIFLWISASLNNWTLSFGLNSSGEGFLELILFVSGMVLMLITYPKMMKKMVE